MDEAAATAAQRRRAESAVAQVDGLERRLRDAEAAISDSTLLQVSEWVSGWVCE